MNSIGQSETEKMGDRESKFILYSPYMNSFVHGIRRILNGPFREDRYEVFVHRKELIVRLQRRHDICAAVLIAPTRKDLERILQLQRVLDGMPLLMILPDREPDTISKAHRFRPRFLTYVDDDLSEIIGVVKKIMDNFDQRMVKAEAIPEAPGAGKKPRRIHYVEDHPCSV